MDISQVQRLIRSRLSVDQKNSDHKSLWHIAIQSQSSTEVIQFLLDLKADVNAETALQDTPLHLAVKTNIETVLLLIKYGANINAKNFSGMTPLHKACHDVSNLDIIKILVEFTALMLTQKTSPAILLFTLLVSVHSDLKQ